MSAAGAQISMKGFIPGYKSMKPVTFCERVADLAHTRASCTLFVYTILVNKVSNLDQVRTDWSAKKTECFQSRPPASGHAALGS